MGSRPRGSSPHARGARFAKITHGSTHRIIPACAGSTRSGPRARRARRDHPRIRGEHVCSQTGQEWMRGSSPHARGAQHVAQLRERVRGIIPACAGSTVRHPVRPPAARDHPRMRGGTSRASAWARPWASPWADHPRMRGEHVGAPVSGSSGTGSSPHARGAPGKYQLSITISGDHPRMRGEHLRAKDPAERRRESSPHARGAPCGDARGGVRSRIIPACAGSTDYETNSFSLC